MLPFHGTVFYEYFMKESRVAVSQICFYEQFMKEPCVAVLRSCFYEHFVQESRVVNSLSCFLYERMTFQVLLDLFVDQLIYNVKMTTCVILHFFVNNRLSITRVNLHLLVDNQFPM